EGDLSLAEALVAVGGAEVVEEAGVGLGQELGRGAAVIEDQEGAEGQEGRHDLVLGDARAEQPDRDEGRPQRGPAEVAGEKEAEVDVAAGQGYGDEGHGSGG